MKSPCTNCGRRVTLYGRYRRCLKCSVLIKAWRRRSNLTGRYVVYEQDLREDDDVPVDSCRCKEKARGRARALNLEHPDKLFFVERFRKQRAATA